MGVLRIKPVLQAWGRTLRGGVPSLSIEITKECPLRCPGCYAYEDAHLGTMNLRSLSDFKGQELIARVLDVVDQHRPLHLSIVGGDPLVRYRELEVLLPQLVKRAHIQVVTSAFRPIPVSWAKLPNLQLVVSVDGLQPEHDVRRKPATYERILRNIQGHHHHFSEMRYRLSATTICLLSMSAASASVRSSSIRWKSLCFSVSCTPIVLKRRAFPFMSTPRTVTSQ